MYSEPLAYFLTWHTYGTWLHGDAAGSIDAQHNRYGSEHIGSRPQRLKRVQDRMKHPPLVLDPRSRALVDEVVVQHCAHRRWQLHARAVRSNHLHVVVTATAVEPEQIVRQLKQWATRKLRVEGLVPNGRKVWADHASTRYLFNNESVERAVVYTVKSQDRAGEHSR